MPRKKPTEEPAVNETANEPIMEATMEAAAVDIAAPDFQAAENVPYEPVTEGEEEQESCPPETVAMAFEPTEADAETTATASIEAETESMTQVPTGADTETVALASNGDETEAMVSVPIEPETEAMVSVPTEPENEALTPVPIETDAETTAPMSIKAETEAMAQGSTGVDAETTTPAETGIKTPTSTGADTETANPASTEAKADEPAPEKLLTEDGPEETAPADEVENPVPATDKATGSAPAAAKKRTARPSAKKPKEPAPITPLPAPAKRLSPAPILTISSDGEVETPEAREDLVWHELQNAYRTRKILTGSLGGIERMEGGGSIAIVYYKELRVAIPVSEMMVHLAEDDSHDYGELASRQNKIIGNMLGAEIDFIVKGLDASSRSVVASRKDAMHKKRQIFYLPDASGSPRVHEDRIVQARVIAVAEKVVRVEVFGVECSILARDLSWDWLGDANERFQVGGQVLVRILQVRVASLEDISIKADVKSVAGNTSKANLGKCKVQGKYAGTVTDVHKGTVFVRLSIGVNAIAHSCYDSRMPGKKDEVSFVITRIDEERNVAVGLISRIIRPGI